MTESSAWGMRFLSSSRRKEGASMPRVTMDTPDPQWFKEVAAVLDGYLEEVRHLPIFLDAKSGSLSHVKAALFLIQIGRGIIEPFPRWLGNMEKRAGHIRLAATFLRLNRIEERKHWEWWVEMAAHYHVRPEDFNSTHAIREGVAGLSKLLDAASTEFPLAWAMAAVNLTIESGAAAITSEIAPHVLPTLPARAKLWIEAHEKGDQDHAANSRVLIKSSAKDDPVLQRGVKIVVTLTAIRFAEALRSAYQ